ncbi:MULTISPECIES: hypothetical protein [unclassified Rhodococcus (in: high G+C Gram-positive bacteria)]|uniref:hypothetical protein n=1 Tax=unclassified Rhodococcus (in: high G+C Gram-positive bacteria) TaxID=192944 RepID=UPI0012E3B516|nr:MULTISPECIES: hypothetical protein [unclassified Rhodococcus (in: high G+C Gram-positive bacteria)]
MPPPDLGERAAGLWKHYSAKSGFDAPRAVLLTEACRLVDRGDKLDAVLAGDGETWMALVHDLRTESYELRIDNAAVEARQTSNTLRQIIAALESEKPTASAGGSLQDELAAARARRTSGA